MESWSGHLYFALWLPTILFRNPFHIAIETDEKSHITCRLRVPPGRLELYFVPGEEPNQEVSRDLLFKLFIDFRDTL